MATRGAESANKATEERPALAERRILRPAQAGASRSRLVIRLRSLPDGVAISRAIGPSDDGDGKAFRTLNILDEYSRECLAIRVRRKLNSVDVIDALSDLFILRGVPAYIRSANGPEFVAEAVRKWIGVVGAKTAFIEPGSPWENGYCESFNGRFRPSRQHPSDAPAGQRTSC